MVYWEKNRIFYPVLVQEMVEIKKPVSSYRKKIIYAGVPILSNCYSDTQRDRSDALDQKGQIASIGTFASYAVNFIHKLLKLVA